LLLGCRVDALSRAEAVRRIVELAHGNEQAQVVTLGTEMIVRAYGDPGFRGLVNAATLSLCDTVGVLHAARARGIPVPELVTGVDLIDPLCEALAAQGLSIFLLGARGDTTERVGRMLLQRHPALRLAGCRDGYFTSSEDSAVAAQIARSGAHVLLVGMGSPRQEYWIAEHVREAGCRVGIGVGGSFDVLAGNVKRAPSLWRRLHAEWLYRLIREPWRWRRQLALPRFIFLVLREAIVRDREKQRA
jgi:N-acetylglucosaminyldiphosphoundecaprenol N-acetyl-beta-D-mannosaminyltransferase